jgi:hypothetical protein
MILATMRCCVIHTKLDMMQALNITIDYMKIAIKRGPDLL